MPVVIEFPEGDIDPDKAAKIIEELSQESTDEETESCPPTNESNDKKK